MLNALTPYALFLYLCAIAGGLLLLGLVAFFVFGLFIGVIGWARRPVATDEVRQGKPYQTIETGP